MQTLYRLFTTFILLITCLSSSNASITGEIFHDTVNSAPKKNKNIKLIGLPVFLKSPEFGIGGGAAASITFKTNKSQTDSTLRTSYIQSLGLYTSRKQTVLAIDGTIFFPGEKYILRLHNSFTNFPDRFWGIGNHTSNFNEEKYSYQQLYLFPQFLKKVYKHFFVGIAAEYQHIFNVTYDKNGMFEKDKVLGVHKSTVNGVGILLSHDTRNNAFSPDKGVFLELSATNFAKPLKSDFQYLNVILDCRKYLKFRSKDVWAFQTYLNLNKGRVPFLSLAALGGSSIMRGYYSGRYRDKNLFAIQTEYRLHIWRRFGVVAFASVGEVSRNLRNVQIASFKYAVGGGLRYAVKKSEKLNLRLDYGVAPSTSGIYFTVAEAF